MAILVAAISLLAIQYWPEKPVNGYKNVLRGTYQKQPVTDPDHWLHVVMPFIDLTLTEGDIPPVREPLEMLNVYKLFTFAPCNSDILGSPF